jgi:ATP-dependent helicase Lhr and Lhr-like helicase
MESRGEIRGGRFVASFIGEQFALPEALDLLRAIRRNGETAEASTCDLLPQLNRGAPLPVESTVQA